MRILALTAALVLVGCSQPPTQPVPLQAQARATAPIIVATLSTNACEARVSPVYTAAQVATERATRYVSTGQLSPDLAQSVLELGRSAKVDLDAACPNATLDGARLAAAEVAVGQMQTILGGVR